MSKKTSKKIYTFNGKTQNLYQWAADTGIPFETLRYRLMRGWSLEDCFTRPARKWQKREPGQKKHSKSPIPEGCCVPDCENCPLPDCEYCGSPTVEESRRMRMAHKAIPDWPGGMNHEYPMFTGVRV